MFDAIRNRVFRVVFKALVAHKPPPQPEVFTTNRPVEQLATYIKKQGIRKLLIMTSAGLVKLNLLSPLLADLPTKSIEYQIFDKVEPNPSFTTVEAAITTFHAAKCDGVIAFGGGSVIDAAKAVVLQVGNNVPLENLVGIFRAKHQAAPFFVVPTTAGTGSEITSSAVLTNPQTRQKVFITDHKSIPLAIALDPSTMLGLPSFITVDTGMDALTHAIEAYISAVNVPDMMDIAATAVTLIFENLSEAYTNGDSRTGRSNMSIASFQAGMAFNHMGLGYVHGISHQLTAFYGIPHGRANAVVLPYVLEASLPSIAPELASLAKAAGLAKQNASTTEVAHDFVRQIKALSRRLSLPTGFAELKHTDFAAIARNARKEVTANYPVKNLLSVKSCEEILHRLLLA